MNITLQQLHRIRVAAVTFAVLGNLALFSPLVSQAETRTGTYVSPAIGTSGVVEFKKFVIDGFHLPDQSSISIRFAGSKDNYATWSGPIAVSGDATGGRVNLATIAELQGSQFLKVEIKLTQNSTTTPSVDGFTVVYDTVQEIQVATTNNTNTNNSGSSSNSTNSSNTTVNTGTSTTTTSPSPSATPMPSTTTTTTAPTTSPTSTTTSSISPTPTTSATVTPTQTSTPVVTPKTETKTVSFAAAQTAKTTKKLVSTGAILWFNLGVALFFSLLTAWWFILRHRAPQPSAVAPVSAPYADDFMGQP